MKKILDRQSDVSAKQFQLFRAVFGIYLCFHFAALIPYAGEIFSLHGIMGMEGINPFNGTWPNPIFYWGTPTFVEIFIAIGVFTSVLFALGRLSRTCALILWFLHSCLYTANPLTANPSLGYVGMLLLLCAAVPKDFKKLPRLIPLTAWVLLATGYTFSGILKLSSPSWIDGSALMHLMHNPLARPGFVRHLMLHLPDGSMMAMTWAVLFLEVCFIPLAILRSTRQFAWFAMLLMHIGIVLTIDFTDLSLGMIMVHLFTVQGSWLTAWKKKSEICLRYTKNLTGRFFRSRIIHLLFLVLFTIALINACSSKSPHNGIFPFSSMEKPFSKRSVIRKTQHTHREPQQMAVIVDYHAAKDREDFAKKTALLRTGDVIAFYMSHSEARGHLKHRKLQKIPYELFRYGHVSIIVPDPHRELEGQGHADHRLLQVAMKQAVNTDASWDYLQDKSWIAYRPPAGSIDVSRLHQFTQYSTKKCSSPDDSYDFKATLGLGNGNLFPLTEEDVRKSYTCTTLIVAALSYSGFDLYAAKRNGYLDIMTPRQVTDAWGIIKPK